MQSTLWYVIAGLLLVLMALAGSLLRRLPLTASMFYLAAGFGIGPAALGLLRLDPLEHSALLERLSEIAVIISLFTAGLKLRIPLSSPRWWLPLRLASVSMVLSVALVAAAGVLGLGMPPGAAVLLGAVLAPTDPVLASDVQVNDPFDRDRLRFALTGEAGMNDGTAFPFVMLGLGLLGLHEIGPGGWRWVVVDLLWATVAGIGVGLLLGTLVARLVIYLRHHHREAVGLDDFLALGLIALSYGVALLIHGYGFLAVFTAGLALRRVEAEQTRELPPEEVRNAAADEQQATHPEKAPAYMAAAVLGFNEQVERIGEVAVVVMLGALLVTVSWPMALVWFIPLLFVVIRPLAVLAGLAGSGTPWLHGLLMGWFGIRGVGSLYYLMYAIQHGLPADLARSLTSLTLATVVLSVAVHGASATPLMDLYQRHWRMMRGKSAVVPTNAANG